MNALPDTPHLAPSVYAARRRALLERIGDGIAVVPTAPQRLRNRDSYYPYRPDSYFHYLSGFPEPEALVVLVGGAAPRSLLFCREKDEARETWEGFRYGPDAACASFGFDEACAFSEIDARLPELFSGVETLWLPFGTYREWETRVFALIDGLRATSRAGTRAPTRVADLCVHLDDMRRVKDTSEIALMRKAAAIASAGHVRAMRACRVGMAEYALEAELDYEFRRLGANGHAYPPIVAGGANACVLHYDENRAPLAEGTLVLIDAGCEFENYAADITRTFPVGGRFTPAQRDVYEIVLAAQAAAFSAIAPGASFDAYHEAALRVLVQGLVDLKVLSGAVDGLIESEAYKPYYMHRTGHWLGLDVHDAGEYVSKARESAVLAPGMTLTVEPGLYFRPGCAAPEAFHGTGVRIEDDVLVTETGAEVYTSAPKTVAEIESLVGRQ
ncbi:MAG: aminopeptidase P N-terminal domain-containing protein [Candidatus Accumulibacter sp.]|jgi:Xaa-Pro aminopeptidase|nr:aminopeptidase P N-terminal domain-containing protein [Accumulibacter sp.]